MIFAADVMVVEARFGSGDHELVMHRKWNFKIAVNEAILKFDLQRVQSPAVANSGKCARFDSFALDA
jgi:hypothetical protein